MARRGRRQADMEAAGEIGVYNLLTGEDSYTSQVAQNPLTSRRVKSWIPQASGLLTREGVEVKLAALNIGLAKLYDFYYTDANGVVSHQLLAATATSLYFFNGTNWVQDTNLVLANFPTFETYNNLLYVSDGVKSFEVQGPISSVTPFQIAGFPIPDASIVPAIDTSAVGTLTIASGRYYWFTVIDDRAGYVHESSSSAISASTGAITNKKVRVTPFQGTISAAGGGNPLVTGVGTNFTQAMVGMYLYTSGVFQGIIASVADTTHLNASPAGGGFAAVNYLILPNSRAQGVHIYASESETSQIGNLLATIKVTDANFYYDDQSPFLGNPGSLFTQITRPFRNDPPIPSRILTLHKNRLWRRRETSPRFYMFSANEEVLATLNGAPADCWPGTDAKTQSDLVNEYQYPQPAAGIRALVSHGDALYIGSEKDIIPLFGNTLDDFATAQFIAFRKGFASPWAAVSSAYGLLFASYDKQVLLYPSSMPPPEEATTVLIELSLPIRNKVKVMDSSNLFETLTITDYNYGERKWVVFSYRDTDGATYRTWVYDFVVKGWFELQKGFFSTVVWEAQTGKKVLLGQAADGFTYVIDDVNGIYDMTGTLPLATFRTALIDFKEPNKFHVFRWLEYEIDKTAMSADLTFNVYYDPLDADNPGTPVKLTPVQVTNSKFRCFTQDGAVCNRLMIEIIGKSAAGATLGSLRSLLLKADTLPDEAAVSLVA